MKSKLYYFTHKRNRKMKKQFMKILTEEKYDSINDTNTHRKEVKENIKQIVSELNSIGLNHDLSKTLTPEKEGFDEYTPKLKALTYGSDEYKQTLKELNKTLKHHYDNNRHHPEHFSNGINEMTLIDIIEMLCDWKAATKRHANGNMQKSLEINKDRFKISDQLQQILKNTVDVLKW